MVYSCCYDDASPVPACIFMAWHGCDDDDCCPAAAVRLGVHSCAVGSVAMCVRAACLCTAVCDVRSFHLAVCILFDMHVCHPLPAWLQPGRG